MLFPTFCPHAHVFFFVCLWLVFVCLSWHLPTFVKTGNLQNKGFKIGIGAFAAPGMKASKRRRELGSFEFRTTVETRFSAWLTFTPSPRLRFETLIRCFLSKLSL